MVESVPGVVADIHRASTVDGPGLRTTVFLKGCPLRCVWCHNPETQRFSPEPAFDASKATAQDWQALRQAGCDWQNPGAAVDGLLKDKWPRLCAESVSGALSVYGKVYSVDELVKVVMKDYDYYKASGGGVTVSGGEPLAQPRFALGVLSACRSESIHTILDTSGYSDERWIRQSLETVDRYLYDYKATSPEKHQQLTGKPLEPVLRNLGILAKNGAKITLRCPLVPGFNDDATHLTGIAALASRFSPAIDRVDLLTWHTMGRAKYSRLGRVPDCGLPLSNVDSSQKARYRQIVGEAMATGIPVHVF